MKLFVKRLFVISMLALCLVGVNPVLAHSPLAVELISFTAVGIPNGVELRWETATELSASAFYLSRGQGGGFTNLTQIVDANGSPYPGGLVEAEGSPTVGATYIARDLTAVPGQTYTYQLVEVESSNQSSVIATTTVSAGGAPTPTQITIGGNTTPTAGASPTAPPTNTAVATVTTISTTAPATATPTRTMITPTPAAAANQIVSTSAPEDSNANNPGSGSSMSNSQPTLPTATQSGIVAVAQVQPTAESPYPGSITTPETEDSYPVPEIVVTPLTLDTTETPYPANFLPEQQPTPTIVGVVGSRVNSGSLLTTEAQPATPASSSGILWLGFLAGLLIFVAAIAGSIVLFVRRR